MYKELFLLPTENLAVLPGDRNRFSVSKGLQQKTKALSESRAQRC